MEGGVGWRVQAETATTGAASWAPRRTRARATMPGGAGWLEGREDRWGQKLVSPGPHLPSHAPPARPGKAALEGLRGGEVRTEEGHGGMRGVLVAPTSPVAPSHPRPQAGRRVAGQACPRRAAGQAGGMCMGTVPQLTRAPWPGSKRGSGAAYLKQIWLFQKPTRRVRWAVWIWAAAAARGEQRLHERTGHPQHGWVLGTEGVHEPGEGVAASPCTAAQLGQRLAQRMAQRLAQRRVEACLRGGPRRGPP